MPISPNLTIVQKFTISSFLVMALGAAVLGFRLDREIERQAINQAATETASFVDRVFRLQLRMVPGDRLTREHIEELRRFLLVRPLGEEVPVVKVWGPDGRVIYATDSRLIGKKYPIAGGLARALRGKVHSHLSSLEKTENVLERRQYGRMLEVYVPLRSEDGRIIGAFESYQTTDKLYADLGSARAEFWSDIAIIFTLFTGVLFFLFRRDVVGPIRALTEATQRAGRGQYPEEHPYTGKNEVGCLAAAFGEMGNALRNREEELKRNNTKLEESRKILDRQLSERIRELTAVDDLTAAIFASPDPSRIPQVAVELLGKVLGARSGAVFFFDDEIGLVGSCHLPEAQSERFEDPKGSSEEKLAARALAAQNILVAEDIDAEEDFEDFREAGRQEGFRALSCVPITSKGRPLGAVFHYFAEPRAWKEHTLRFATVIANEVGLAVENALLYSELEKSYREQHRIARVLQKSMLPAELPRVPGTELGAYYASATTGATVGGDFYDVFPLRDGRVAIAIGDVCGKGVEAAAAMAMVKSLVRGLAAENPSPSVLLTRLNNAVEGQLKDGSFITLLYGVYDGEEGDFTYASAGHIPPFVLSDDARHHQSGIPLGVVRRRKYSERTLRLGPGDPMVLVTDGLIEARRDGELFGFERCREILEKYAGRRAQPLAELLYRKCLEYAEQLQDDVAILVVKREAEKTRRNSHTIQSH